MRKTYNNSLFVNPRTWLSMTLTNALVWGIGCKKSDEPNGNDTNNDSTTNDETSVSTTEEPATGSTTDSTTGETGSSGSAETTATTMDPSTESGSSSGGPVDGDPATAYNQCDDCAAPNFCVDIGIGSVCMMPCSTPNMQGACPNPPNGTAEALCATAQGMNICVLLCEMADAGTGTGSESAGTGSETGAGTGSESAGTGSETGAGTGSETGAGTGGGTPSSNCPTGMECMFAGGSVPLCLWPPEPAGTETGSSTGSGSDTATDTGSGTATGTGGT